MADKHDDRVTEGTSRRDVLKLGGAATLGGIAAMAANPLAAGASSHVIDAAKAAGYTASAEINGVAVQGFSSVDVIEASSDVVFAVDQATGRVTATPGLPTSQKVTFTKDWSNTSEWYRWRKSVIDGKVDRRSISVIFHNDAGQEAGRMNFFNCWPSKWSGPALNAKSSGHASEKLEISWETMELKAG